MKLLACAEALFGEVRATFDVSRRVRSIRILLLPWPAVTITAESTPISTPATEPDPVRDRPDRVWPILLWFGLGFLALFIGYEAARDFVAPAALAERPYENAHQIIDLERSMGLFIEPDVQRIVHAIPGGRFVTTWFYTIAYTAGYLTFFLWVFFYRRSRMRFMFTWFWITNFVAVLSYWIYPLAPPRFMDNLGMEDTTKEAVQMGGSLSWFEPFRNLYAAMPSMHVGQTLLYAFAIVLMVRSPWKHLIWLWPAFMLTTVMATANHYWMDGVGGLICVGIAYGITRLILPENPREVRDMGTPPPRQEPVPA